MRSRVTLQEHRAHQEQEHSARRAAAREASAAHRAIPARTLSTVSMTGGTRAAAPKSKPYRCQALLDMARGRACLLCPPGQCRCTPGSTVACHSNHQCHSKGMGRKADDCYSVWGGDVAHRALDQGGAPAAEKEAIFMAAHLRQVLAWREVAADPSEPERFRRAARRALEHLNATPGASL